MPPVTGVDVVARRRMRTGLDAESGPSAVSTADDAREAFQKSWLRGLLGGVVLGARQPLQAAPGRRYHVSGTELAASGRVAGGYAMATRRREALAIP